MAENRSDAREPNVNPGYAHFQIAKALTTARNQPDQETRQRAESKIAKWLDVLRGLWSGKIDFGTRTPVKGAPTWATLEVVTGGFATGKLLAGGELLPHELQLLKQLSAPADGSARKVLNTYFLSDEGLGALSQLLDSRKYDVSVPEEGALLVVAWLVEHDRSDAARGLVETLAPYFSRLRFYPRPTRSARDFGTRVSLESVADSKDRLRKIKPNVAVSKQKAAAHIWAPLHDRMIGLFLETVQGEIPNVRRSETGSRDIVGGWPCHRYPPGWQERAQSLLSALANQLKACPDSQKPRRRNGHFAQLHVYLQRCATNPRSLTGRDVGMIRLILATSITKRGTPDSEQCRQSRAREASYVAGALHSDIARAVLPRLEELEENNGLDDIALIVQPISSSEAQIGDVLQGTEIPHTIRRKVERCLRATVDVLCKRGLITSGETLARVLPQMTSTFRAAAIRDESLRHLDASIYRAFSNRRSLLLLNLEKQVKIHELPWVEALDPLRTDGSAVTNISGQTLKDVAALALTAFPQTILPNKLLPELQTLANAAQIALPLVEETATDIFMGRFSPKFTAAAHRAAKLLRGTLYERYYQIDFDAITKIPVPLTLSEGAKPSTIPDDFSQMCIARASVPAGTFSPAINGMIVEQSQILTTHNLAALFDALSLADLLRDQLTSLAQRCFIWICRRQQMKSKTYHDQLIMLKNTAYAWRQMIFFLSLRSASDQTSFSNWAEEHLKKQRREFGQRFNPALRGLQSAAGVLTPNGETGQIFLGWSQHRHWLAS